MCTDPEIKEELGFDLQQAVDQGDVISISHFGEAITPPFEPIRFAAHYFKIEMNRRPDLVADSSEIAWSGWVDHKELHRRYCAGEALMVVPTMFTIKALAEDIDARGSDQFNLEYDIDLELPYLELLNGVGMIPVPSNTLPPAKTTNALLIGDEHAQCYLIDPSPESEIVYKKLYHTLTHHRVDGIFITHHHHDHHELAPKLARELAVPLCCSAKTRAYLIDQQGGDYLDQVEVKIIDEGEVLTTWLGQPVRCYNLPGHDAGMLGLAPDNMAWFFISDLAQVGATVVIPSREGSMQSYFESLQRVISLNPKLLIPSHGMPMGGTLLAEKTLQHRLEREQQVLEYMNAGLDADAITREIYQDLDERLMSLAFQNVKQHMKKLRKVVE